MNRQEFLELLKQKTTYNQIYDVINEANYIVFHGYAEGYWSGAVQEEDIVLLLDDFLQLESDIISQIIDMKEYYIGELDGKHSEVMGDVTIFLYKSCKEFNPKSPDILDSYIGDLVEEKWFSECVSKAYRQYKNEKSILQQNKLKARWSKKEDDILISLHHANTLNHVLLFTNKGNYLFVPVHKIEEFKWKDLGKHVSYLVKVGADEKIISSILVQDFNLPLYVLMATKNGQIKRTLLKDFEVSRYSKAITCMKVKEQDTMICALLTDNQQGIFIVSKAGYGGLYSEQEVSIVGLKAAGIKALNLKNDSIAAVDVFDPLENYSVLILSEDGQMKRLKLNDIPACKRTTKGTTLYKNLKTKTIYVKNAFVLSSKESASVYTSKSKEYTFKPTDFNNASLESRFSSFIKLEKDETILWSQINRVITTNDYDVKQENQNLQSGVIELKESKEKTLLDDFDIQEVPIKKETSNSKKKNTIKYEKITLEDILNDDEF